MTSAPTIAMITDDFAPAVTGVGVHVQKVAGELVRRGHRVVVVTSRRRGQPAFDVTDGVRVHRVRCVSVQGFAQALPRPIELERIFRDEGVGIVHFHYLGLMMLAGLRAARARGLTTVYTAHMTVDLLVQPLFMRPFRGLLTHLYFALLERLDHVICPAAAQAERVSQFTIRPRVHRVPNPIEFEGGTAPGPKTDDRFTVLYVGRLGPEKNLGLLLRAFRIFAEGRPGAEVKIAGEGVMESVWRDLARTLGVADRVRFLGRVPHEDLPRLYADCDVFFLPSVKEVLALVALEAMRCARPVIVTDRIVCGPELVEEGENGWIVSADRPEEAAERLARLAADPDLARRLGQRSLEKSGGYTLPAVGAQLGKIYAAALAPAPVAADLDTEVRARRRGTCVFCGTGRLDEAVESLVFPAEMRNPMEEFFRLWRCRECLSLHAAAEVSTEDFEKRSPFLRRRLNFFNRRMFAGFHAFLGRLGVRRTDALLIYGLSADLFKTVFEQRGQAPVDTVDRALPAGQLAAAPAKAHDVVVVMEYLECADDPRQVLSFAARQLKPGGLLVIHTPDAEKIKLVPQESHRLYQPHRIHIAGAGILKQLVEKHGFRLRETRHRNYMDTLWPFVNYRAFHELPYWGDGTLNAAIEFKASHLARAWWRLPRLLFLGLFGGWRGDASNLIAVFEKTHDPVD